MASGLRSRRYGLDPRVAGTKSGISAGPARDHLRGGKHLISQPRQRQRPFRTTDAASRRAATSQNTERLGPKGALASAKTGLAKRTLHGSVTVENSEWRATVATGSQDGRDV